MTFDGTDWAPLVPELVVNDFDESLRFWTKVLGFDVLYQRTNPDFAMLRLGRAQVMLEARNETSWITGTMERPLGRGINLEIAHPDPAGLAERLERSGVAPYRPLQVSHYQANDIEIAQLAVLVQDPDGYLLRFAHNQQRGVDQSSDFM